MCLRFLLCTPGYTALREVVDRYLNGNVVSLENSDIIHTKLTRYVSGHYVTVGKLNFEDGVGKNLNYRAFKFDNIVLRQNNHPNLICAGQS